jgi:flagellar biosynthetic protein FliR
MIQLAFNFVPLYVLVLFRIAGMMIMAPLLGSSVIPKRVRTMMACVLAASIAPQLSTDIAIPSSPWNLAMAIGGEIIFGAAIGLILSLVFVAGQWAGEIISQQMGLNIGQTLNPQYGGGSSVVGDLYFYLSLLVFLAIDGEKALVSGVFQSFSALPLLSVSANRPLLQEIVSLFQAAMVMAMQLAAPMLVTMLVVDLILGFIGKTLPQLNIMTAGISVRSVSGMMVLIVGISLTSSIIRTHMLEALGLANRVYTQSKALTQ